MSNKPKQVKLNRLTREDLIEYLSKYLTDAELVLLLNTVFDNRAKEVVDESIPYLQLDRFLLTQQSMYGDPSSLDSERNFVACHNPGKYSASYPDRSQALCNSGDCLKCGIDFVSYAKHVICPVCGSQAYCT